MLKTLLLSTIFCCFFIKTLAQTTDLAVVIEAQTTNNVAVSQVEIYQEFQYILTIINSGNTVENATFSIDLNNQISIESYTSQNAIGGATEATNFNLDQNNIITGSVANLPNNSSVAVKILALAPINTGGIAASAIVTAPSDIEDTNISNNQSIISINVIDVPIDFSVTYAQTSPTLGTAISAWNDTATYQVTITNNSSIAYPLNGFNGIATLSSPLAYGIPVMQLQSVTCVESTNGTTCPNVSVINGNPVVVSSSGTIFSFGTVHTFTAGGSVTFNITYTYLQPGCALEQEQIVMDTRVDIMLGHTNQSSNSSNSVETLLLTAELCDTTDICIDTIQTSPSVGTLVDWGEEVTFETTVCNNGPLEAPILFFLQNLSTTATWNIISTTCIATSGTASCDDFIITNQDILWSTSTFTMPVGATITIETVVIFLEPECSTSPQNTIAHIRSGTNILDSQIFDINIANNAQSDYVTLPPTSLCPSSDLQVSKTQISPVAPEGTSPDSTTEWGPITYEITVSNMSDIDTFLVLSDYITLGNAVPVTGTLTEVSCVATTGTAQCFEINNTAIGIPLDGEPENGNYDIFWEIKAEDNWALPAQSSVTFQATVNWDTACSNAPIPVINNVIVSHADDTIIDTNNGNNSDQVTSYLAACIDLIVQTFPEFTQVTVNDNFDWIVDISNSETSSNAINVYFEDTLDSAFTISGTPTCTVTTATATCVTTFSVSGNTVSGTIPNIDTGATIQLRIPVTAPSYGGAFSNTAEAIPDITDNKELTPETNISISNVQVIAPSLFKAFSPETIFENQESILTFTVYNLATNPIQSDISFTDNLPNGVFIAGTAYWNEANGCTAIFTSTIGGTAIAITQLSFPEGVASCTFSIPVTSSNTGIYTNSTSNFDNKNNIDTSQTFAQLNVIEDTTNVDIAVQKQVIPTEAAIGEQVVFNITATHLGTTLATGISIRDLLPEGLNFVSASTTLGDFDSSTFEWSLEELSPTQTATLSIVATVLSSDNLMNIAQLEHVNEIDRDDTNNRDTAEVVVNNCLEIPEGFSPNDDGVNDYFVIPCIKDYTENTIKIYNRLGTLIYQSDNYQNDWDGKPNKGFPKNNTLLPVGTYYYIVTLPNNAQTKVGWVYLNY